MRAWRLLPHLSSLLLVCCVQNALGQVGTTDWTPNFTLSIDVVHDEAHAEAIVPDVCDAAKRNVTFHFVPRRREYCLDPKRRLDIVLAFSIEDISDLSESISVLLSAPSIKATDPCFLVGSKVRGASEILEIDGVDTVFELGNAGREWAVYITYLISYYGNLPQHVAFMHGRLNFPAPELLPRLALFGPDTGVLGAGSFGRCHCRGCNLPAPTFRLRELWSMFRRSFCPQSYQVFFNGHYIVSRKRLMAHPIHLYKVLYRYVMHTSQHFLSGDAHEQMQNAPGHTVNFVNHLTSCEDTLGGHIVERSWSFIFGCYQQPTRDACTAFNGTAAGLNPTCAYNGWQCYDSMPPWQPTATAP